MDGAMDGDGDGTGVGQGCLLGLPDELLLCVLKHALPSDVLSLRCVCRRLAAVGASSELWQHHAAARWAGRGPMPAAASARDAFLRRAWAEQRVVDELLQQAAALSREATCGCPVASRLLR
jgi:hypothetical protein